MKESNITISADEAAEKLLEQDENGKYKIGNLSGVSERENLTQVVKILNQINLTEADENGFKNLRNALGMIGAYDRYGYLGPQGEINKLSEFYEKSKNGDMAPARMYVNKFFGNMDTFSRSQIDDKFTDIMAMWVETSEGMLEKNTTISMKDFTREALSSREKIIPSDLKDGTGIETEVSHGEKL